MQVIYYSEWTGSVRDHFAPCLSVICCSSMMRTRELLSVFVLLLLFLTIQIILQYYLFRVWHSQCCQRQRIICTQSCFGINNKTSKESKTTWSPRIFFCLLRQMTSTCRCCQSQLWRNSNGSVLHRGKLPCFYNWTLKIKMPYSPDLSPVAASLLNTWTAMLCAAASSFQSTKLFTSHHSITLLAVGNSHTCTLELEVAEQ